MANIYSSEPPTSGKVILKTNYGNIDIELWTKEAPRACRNFIQLCMEGYYNNVIFHRIIKSFMIQTGDPTGTGDGGESIWNKEFPDEFHSRIRFSHRGMVAMANKNKPNTNGSQFFMTMDKCPWLDKKHTIFGKIIGDTIFNAMNISQLPTKDDFPIDDVMPKIIKTEIIINPFMDIVPRENKLTSNFLRFNKDEDEVIYDKKEIEQKKLKKLTNNNLISFDSDEDKNSDEGEGKNNFKLGRKNKITIKPLPELLKNEEKIKNNFKVEQEIENNISNKINIPNNLIITNNSNNSLDSRNVDDKGYEIILDEKFIHENGLDEDKLLNFLQFKNNNDKISTNQVKNNLQENNIKNINKDQQNENESESDSDSSNEYDNDDNFESEKLKKKIAEEKEYMENNQSQNINFDLDQERKEEMQKIKQDIQLIKNRMKNKKNLKDEEADNNIKLTPLQEMRMKYLKNKRPRNPKEIVEKLNNFVKNLKVMSKEEGNWMNNKLKFHTDSQKAYNFTDTKEKVMRNFDFNNL